MNVNDNHQTRDKWPVSSVKSLVGKVCSQLNSGLGKLVNGLNRRIRHWETTTSLRKRRLQVGFVFGVVVVVWLIHVITLCFQPVIQPTTSTPKGMLSTQRPPGLSPAGQPVQPQPPNNH